MASKPKIVGVCKHCFCAVGYDEMRNLVHVRNLKKHCSGGSKQGKIAELRK